MLQEKIRIEEKLISKILFSEINISKQLFENINYEKLIKISSEHLLIPTIYSNLKRKKYLRFVPLEFSKYISEIYEINRNRNKILIEEAKFIAGLLEKEKHDYVFLKGTAHLLSDVYNDIGERMIGDIDIIGNKKNEDKIFKAIEKFGYEYSSEEYFFPKINHHFPRMISKKKMFAIEVHTRLVRNRFILNNNFINNNEINNGVKVPNLNNQLIHNIYNNQINDYCYKFLNYNYRSYYDYYKISQKQSLDKTNLKILKDKYVKNYFFIANELGINFEKSNESKKNLILKKIRFRLKRKYKIYRFFDKLLCRFSERLLLFPMQIRKLIISKKYRAYLIKKYQRMVGS